MLVSIWLANGAGTGVARIDGKIIDHPHLQSTQKILDRWKTIGRP